MSTPIIRLIKHGVIPMIQIIFTLGIIISIVSDTSKMISKKPKEHNYPKLIIKKIIYLIIVVFIMPFLISQLLKVNLPTGISAYASSKHELVMMFTIFYSLFMSVIIIEKTIRNIKVKYMSIIILLIFAPILFHTTSDILISIHYCNNNLSDIYENIHIANLSMLIASVITIIVFIFITKHLVKGEFLRLLLMCLLAALMMASFILYIKGKNEAYEWYHDYTKGCSICNTCN